METKKEWLERHRGHSDTLLDVTGVIGGESLGLMRVMKCPECGEERIFFKWDK